MILHYRFNHSEPYTVIHMSEENASTMPSGMKAYSVLLEARTKDAELDYFIVVENAGTVGIEPVDYTKRPYKVKLSELNK